MFHMYVYEDPGEPALRENLLRRSVSLYVQDSSYFDKFRIDRTEKGKPYLADSKTGQPVSGLHFSISHSGGFWAAIIGPEPCGLDIQAHRPVSYEKLAARYFPGKDLSDSRSEEEGLKRFYRLWCRREALAKYTGRGFFGVGEGISTMEGCSTADEDGKPVYFRELDFKEGFTAVWCSGGEDDEIRWIR